jgi:hypothetical protein
VWQVDDEYLFGADMLVTPLFEAQTTGRDVYLPQGQWIDYQTGKLYPARRGGAFACQLHPLAALPAQRRRGFRQLRIDLESFPPLRRRFTGRPRCRQRLPEVVVCLHEPGVEGYRLTEMQNRCLKSAIPSSL